MRLFTNKISNLVYHYFFLSLLFVTLFSLSSCRGSASDEGENAVTYIVLSSEGGVEKLLGNTFTFKVQNNLNQDVTSESTIYVNGNQISGNTFTPTEKGVYTVSAKYKEYPGNPIEISVLLNEGVNFKHRILYEEFTGTWCGYCTIGLARHENLLLQTQNLVFIGIHGPVGTNDPWTSPLSTEMENFKNVNQWPTMYINRNVLWPYDSDFTNMTLPLSQLNASSKIGIKMKSTVSGSSMTAEVNVLFAENYSDLKIASFIVEDKLVHDQKNYIPTLYGGAPVIKDFVHHNVLRSKLTPVAGEAIPSSQTVVANEFNKNFQYTIPSNFNQANLKIIVMIMDGAGKVLNVREENLGTENNFEIL